MKRVLFIIIEGRLKCKSTVILKCGRFVLLFQDAREIRNISTTPYEIITKTLLNQVLSAISGFRYAANMIFALL
jgi:hypothetical protein